jgi:putative ABC transport system permease protein
MGLFTRLKNTLLGREAVHQRAEEEAQFHLQMKTEELIEDGMDPHEAQLQARRQFGNLLQQQEATGEMDLMLWLENWMRDLTIAWRRLRSRPAFLITAVTLLSLGIGVNAAIFSVVDLLLLRPLPYDQPDRLVVLQERPGSNSNPQRLRDWQQRVPAFSAVAGQYGENIALRMDDRLEAVFIQRLVGDLVGMLRQPILAGRNFTAKELEGDNVALVAQSALARYFPGNPQEALGKSVRLGNESFQIIGVLADAQGVGERPAFLVPGERDILNGPRRAGFLVIGARLADGETLDSAMAQVRGVAQQLAQQYPETDADLQPKLLTLQDALAQEARSQVLLVQAASGLLMLIACINLAGLLTARAMERRRESAIRVFLGAGRGHLVRLYLSESFILVLLGGLGACLAASWILALLQQTFAAELDRLQDAAIDSRVLIFLAALSVVCGLLFAIAPAWQAARVQTLEHISRFRFRNGLVVLEAALSLILLVGALQLGKSLLELKQRPLGFQPEETIMLRVDLSWATPPKELITFTDAMLADLRALPQTRSVGLADRLPLGGGTQSGVLHIRGEAKPTANQVGFRSVDSGYFSTLGIPLLSGEWSDFQNTAVVNESLARKYLRGNPIGQMISADGNTWYRVSALAGNTRSNRGEAEPMPAVFFHFHNYASPWPLLHFVIKTREPAALLAPAIRAAVARHNPTALLKTIQPMDSFLNTVTEAPRHQASLAALFAGLALLLVLTGVYGVMAGEMTQRTREMGIRMAIGATSLEVLRLGLSRGLGLAAIGASLGAVFAWATLQALQSQIEALRVIDTSIILLAALLVVAGMALAAFVPAWRASRIDPSMALRTE